MSMGALPDYLRKLIASTRGQEILAFVCFFAVITAILLSNLTGAELNLKPGQICPKDIKAPRTIVVIDEESTRKLKEQARARVGNKYQEDPKAQEATEEEVNRFFSTVKEIRQADLNDQQKTERIDSLLAEMMKEKQIVTYNSAEIARYLVRASDKDIENLRQGALFIVKELMQESLKEDTMSSHYREVGDKARSLSFHELGRRTIEVVVVYSLHPKLIFDREATERAMQEAEEKVMPAQRTIKQGQMIVREGDPVTAEHIEILRQLGIQRSRGYEATAGGTALFVLLFMLLVLAYLRRYRSYVLSNFRLVVLLGLIFVLVIGLAKIVFSIPVTSPVISNNIGYLIPVAAGSMLVAILINQNLAYFFTIAAAIFVGLMTEGNSLNCAIVAFVGGAVGSFRVARLEQSSDMAVAGLYIAGINALTVATLALMEPDMVPVNMGIGIAFGAINGLVSSILTIGLMPFLESAFGVTSVVKLLELSNPNQKLLRRLLVEAPGTYHHSIMVGNLAEAAAERVGAHNLVVRVGAYYHDIGKLKRPYFFVENQLGNENPHEKIAPSLSALIITSHIKDGVEMAQEYKLPPLLINFIREHHGTSLVKYFYSRALEDDKKGSVHEETFRYEGPKPQSKETALVMLADSVEAAVRSLSDPTPGRIEGTVHRIIKDKLYDGQLEECNLTFRDLRVIAESFTRVLTGIYHNRVEYPANLLKEFEDQEGKE